MLYQLWPCLPSDIYFVGMAGTTYLIMIKISDHLKQFLTLLPAEHFFLMHTYPAFKQVKLLFCYACNFSVQSVLNDQALYIIAKKENVSFATATV